MELCIRSEFQEQRRLMTREEGVRADPSPELLQTWKWYSRGERYFYSFWLKGRHPRDRAKLP